MVWPFYKTTVVFLFAGFKTLSTWVGKMILQCLPLVPAGHLNVWLCVFNLVQLPHDMKQGCDPSDTPACKCKLGYKNGCDSVNSRFLCDVLLCLPNLVEIF